MVAFPLVLPTQTAVAPLAEPVTAHSIGVHGLTFTCCEEVFVQPLPSVYVYVIVYGPPTPATAGLKEFPDMPVPLKIPPVGEPVKLTAASVTQYKAANPLKLTVGNAVTVTDCDELFAQPLPFVYVYTTVCVPAPAAAGLKKLPLTIPGPLNVPPDGEPVKLTAAADAQ